MDGWNRWIGKKVFLRLTNSRVYSGTIEEVDSSSKPIIFISLKDKFGQMVLITSSEIQEMKEEKK